MRVGCVCLFVFALLTTVSLGCQVPVFRYALERWDADEYPVWISFDQDLTKDEADALALIEKKLTEGNAPNLTLAKVDRRELTDEDLWLLPTQVIDGVGAKIHVGYPPSLGNEEPFWQASLTEANVQQVIDSPLRREVLKEILGGASAVWILLGESEIGDLEIEHFLNEIATSLELPEGVVGNEAFRSGAVDPATIEMDDVLRTGIPLQISFPVIHLNPDDEEEAFTRAMLTGLLPAVGDHSLAIPIFGRGRMMPGVQLTDASREQLRSACEYLCGACSCQVKEQNPGVDLLMSVDWEKHLQGQWIMVDRTLPPLAGAGDFQQAEEETASVVGQENKENHLNQQLAVMAVIAVMVLAAGSWWIRRKQREI